jgi:hypothetical protein
MAAYLQPDFVALKADGALSAFLFVKLGSDADHVTNVGAGGLALGINMNASSAAEDVLEVAYSEAGKLKLAGTVAAGGQIASDAAGKGVAATTGDYVNAQALEAGVAGDIISVKQVNYKI